MLSSVLSMAAFSLVSSLSPGPVNITALSAGMTYGLRPALRHVIGATVGFTILLVCIGFGLRSLGHSLPILTEGLRWIGAAFLLVMAIALARSDGRIARDRIWSKPTLRTGALMQWLNPKAWMASAAGMAVYAADGAPATILLFAAIFFVICAASILCWAWAGAHMGRWITSAGLVRLINRILAGLLAGSAAALLL